MRALLGDSQSLTITGIIESLPIREPPKVQKDKETNDEYTREFKAYKMAFITCLNEAVRGRPPGRAGGSNALMMFQRLLFRSVG